jgi:hypothetical protein
LRPPADGTISSVRRDRVDVLDDADFGTKLLIDQVLARYPEIAAAADVRRYRSAAAAKPRMAPAGRVIHRLAIGFMPQNGSHSGCRERFNILESAVRAIIQAPRARQRAN